MLDSAPTGIVEEAEMLLYPAAHALVRSGYRTGRYSPRRAAALIAGMSLTLWTGLSAAAFCLY